MTDTTTTDTTETTEPVQEPAATAIDAPDLSSEVEKWKAMSRKNEERAKANEAAAKRLAEIEEANKSELERAQARAEAAEKAAQEAMTAKLRSDVALAKGVPASLLTGSTEDEMNESADQLLAFRGTTPAAPAATPQGNQGSQINGSVTDLDDAIAAAEKARNFPLAITLKQQKAAQSKKE